VWFKVAVELSKVATLLTLFINFTVSPRWMWRVVGSSSCCLLPRWTLLGVAAVVCFLVEHLDIVPEMVVSCRHPLQWLSLQLTPSILSLSLLAIITKQYWKNSVAAYAPLITHKWRVGSSLSSCLSDLYSGCTFWKEPCLNLRMLLEHSFNLSDNTNSVNN